MLAWMFLLNDFLIISCAVIAIFISAARFAPYALVAALEWFFLSGMMIDGYPVLKWWQLLLLIGLSCSLIEQLLKIQDICFALCITSSIIVIEFMIYLGMGITGSSGNTHTGVVSTLVTVIGTIIVVWKNYDDADPYSLVVIPIVNVLVRILSSGILALGGYIYGGLFLPCTLGMSDKVQYGMYNEMGLPIAIGFFVVSFIAFLIMDRL